MFVLVCDTNGVVFEGDVERLLDRLHSAPLLREAHSDVSYWLAVYEEEHEHDSFSPIHEDGPFVWITEATGNPTDITFHYRVFLFGCDSPPHATIVLRSEGATGPTITCRAYATEDDMLSNRPEEWVADTELDRRRYFTEVLAPGYIIRGRFETQTVIAVRIG
jgi:hypothetical protein